MKIFVAAVALLALTGSASACGKWGYSDEGVGAWSGACAAAGAAVDGTSARDQFNIISRVRLYANPSTGCVTGVKARHGWDNPPNLVLIGSDQFPEAGRALSIGAGERITSVSWAAKDGCVSYLSLRTNKGNDVTAGSAAAGDIATFTAKDGQYLAAFKGASSTDAACASPLAALSFRWGFDDCDAPAAAEPAAAAAPAEAAAEAKGDLGEDIVAPPPPPPCKKSFTCFGNNGGSLECAGLACDTKTKQVVCRSKLCALHPFLGRACEDLGAESCPSGSGDNLLAAKIQQAQQAKQSIKDAVAAAKGAKPTLGLKLVPVDIPVPEKPTIEGKPGLSTADVTLPTFKLGTPKPAVMQDGLGLGHKKLAKLVAKATLLASKVPTIEQGDDKTVKVPVVTLPTITPGGLKAKTVQVPVLDVSFPNKAREAQAAAGDAAAAAAASGLPQVPVAPPHNKLQDAAMDKLADVLEAAGPKVAQTLSKKVTAAEPLLVKLFGEPPETAPVNVITNTGAPGGLVTLESQYELLNRAQSEPRLFGTILRGFPQALAGAFQASAAQARAAGSGGAAAAAAPAAPGRRLMGVASHLQEAAAKAAAVGPAVQTIAAAAQQVLASDAALKSELKRSALDVKLPQNLHKEKGFTVKLVDVIDVSTLAQCKWSVCGAVELEAEPELPPAVVIEDAKEEVDTDIVVAKKSLFASLRQKAAAAPQMLQLGQQLLGTDLQQPGGAMAATGVKA